MDLAAPDRSGRVTAPDQQAGRPGRLPGRRPGGLPAAASSWWLALAAAAFTAAQLAFVVPHLGLSWDETVYLSQVSGHAPAAYFDAARARGIPLLVAPVAAVTSSVTAVHVDLALASGAAMFLALAVWRPLRPGWQLALAALTFGGLWVTQYYGPQAMPDLWVAFAAVAATGFLLRWAGRPQPGRAGLPALAGLAASAGAAALIRPGDAVFLAAALAAAIIAVPWWRRWPPLAAVTAGLVAGSAEWVIEAYARFGGPLARLHAASGEQGGIGLHAGWWAELRAVSGPTLCRPCTAGWRAPELSIWWLVLPLAVAAGIWAARRGGRGASAALAAWCALALAAQYLFLVGYAAPRFLLPGYALASIPVADAAGWLATGLAPRWRQVAAAVIGVVLAGQLVSQHLILTHEVRGTVAFHQDYARIAADLRALGLRPPCVLKGQQFIPIAFAAGCASAGPADDARRAAVLAYPAARPPRYARHWRRYRLPGTRLLRVVAYLPRRG